MNKSSVGEVVVSSLKTCTTCGITKLPTEFHGVGSDSNLSRASCKVCTRANNKARSKTKPKKRKHVRYFWTRERKHQFKIKILLSLEEKRQDRNLRNRYGISLREYRDLFETQNGVCAICGRGAGKRNLHVDHCHKTGRIRALLCSNCNSTLGKVRDDINILNKLIEYLGKHQNASPTPLT